MVGNAPPSNSVHVQVPGICESGTYRAKGLCKCDSVKDLQRGDYPGLFGWAQGNHKGPYVRGRQREQSQSKRGENGKIVVI